MGIESFSRVKYPPSGPHRAFNGNTLPLPFTLSTGWAQHSQVVFGTTGNKDRSPGKNRRFVIFPKFTDHLCSPASQYPTEWVTKAITRIKCAEREASYSSPSSAEVKSKLSYASTQPHDFRFFIIPDVLCTVMHTNIVQ